MNLSLGVPCQQFHVLYAGRLASNHAKWIRLHAHLVILSDGMRNEYMTGNHPYQGQAVNEAISGR